MMLTLRIVILLIAGSFLGGLVAGIVIKDLIRGYAWHRFLKTTLKSDRVIISHSVGFIPNKYEYTDTGRVITDMTLTDISEVEDQ